MIGLTVIRVATNQFQHSYEKLTREDDSPVGVVHPDRLLSVQNSRLVAHHTRLVERRLAVENEDIPVTEVPVNLLVDSRRGRVQAMPLCGPM